MPQSLLAMLQLLRMIEAELAHVETELLTPVSEDMKHHLLKKAAELRLKQREISTYLVEVGRE